MNDYTKIGTKTNFETPIHQHMLTPSLRAAVWLTATAALLAVGPVEAKNLTINGNFDDSKEPLNGWQYKYELQAHKDENGRVVQGESWYKDNGRLVSVVSENEGRRTVLRLNVETQFLADNPGVKVDSWPIPVKPGGKYRLSAWARTNGPDCRIMVEGYKWKPGVSKNSSPSLYVLRRCYRTEMLYFGKERGGTAGGLQPTWKHDSVELPVAQKGNLTKVAKEKFDEIEFLVVHICAIQGKAGEVFVDDVVLERIN